MIIEYCYFGTLKIHECKMAELMGELIKLAIAAINKISEINWQTVASQSTHLDLPSTSNSMDEFRQIYGTVGKLKINAFFHHREFSDVVLKNDNLFCLSPDLLVAHFVVTNFYCTEYDLLAFLVEWKGKFQFRKFGTLRSCLRLELLTDNN